MIRLVGVSYSYPQQSRLSLESVDLEISDGEMTLIEGPSGGGKSTLLRCMNGLVPQFYGGRFAGEAFVDEVSAHAARPRDLADRIGFVAQDPEAQAVADLVEDDIAFTLENLAIPPAAMRKRVEELLDALSIAHLREREVSQLSGGERQRVAIAGALAAMPGHLVLDEPTSQLDPQSADEVFAALLKLRDELGMTIVLSEHRLERVIAYCDRIVSVSSAITDSGEPRTVLQNMDAGPPLVKLARIMGWLPLPLTIREARGFATGLDLGIVSPRRRQTGATLLRAKDVEVHIAKRKVLGPLDFELRQGEVVAIMGRNGSGKSTLLRALCGLVKDRGQIQRMGRVGYLPQSPASMLFRKTLREEIAWTLKRNGKSPNSGSEAAAADEFSVAHLLDRFPRDCSAGERTRCAMAAALAAQPELVLMDEPTRGMDESSKSQLVTQCRRWAEEGRAVALVTHDVELAARLADRVVILGQGEIVVDAPVQEALTDSLTFSTQVSKILGRQLLTVDDVLAAKLGGEVVF